MRKRWSPAPLQACIEEALLAQQQQQQQPTTTGPSPGSLAGKASQQAAGQVAQREQHAGQAAESQRREIGEALPCGAPAEAGPAGPRLQLLPLLDAAAGPGPAAGPGAGSGGASNSGSLSEPLAGQEAAGGRHFSLADPSVVIDCAVAAAEAAEVAAPPQGGGLQPSRCASPDAAGVTFYPAATTAAAVAAGTGTTHFPVHFSS